MAAKEKGKNIVDHSTLIAKLQEEMKIPEIRGDFSKSFHSLKDLKAKVEPESEMFKKTLSIVSDMKKEKGYERLSDDFKRYLDAYEKQKPVTKKQGEDGKGDIATGNTQAPSSPKQKCKDNQGVNFGPAPDPKPSKLSPSPARKDTGEAEKLKSEIQQLKTECETERKRFQEQSKKMENREVELKERDKEIGEKDKKIKTLEDEAQHLSNRVQEENTKRTNVEKDYKAAKETTQNFERKLNEYSSICYQYETKIKELEASHKKLEKEKAHVEHVAAKNIEHLQGVLKEENRKSEDRYKKLLEERDDLRDRFSKLAGKKLQEQNADIADLSDPNRAMKLSEKFGQLYDDEWTNAFEYLMDKKVGLPLKDAISVLLRLLQECWTFCNIMMETQMESLQNVFLHPDQNPNKYVHQGKKGVDIPRVTSKDTQALKDLRRRIGVSPSVMDEVKQALLAASKSWEKEKKGFDKKHTDVCAPYLQKCAEICWLMALHDPPLFMKMEIKQGEKLDTNIYTVYSASGTTIDFLVWPPLYNGKDGGLLSKGVAEPLRVVGKKK